ncbi:P-II family nitrogen regulator [Methanopyrus kandleri]
MVEAVIRPEKLDDVKEALDEADYPGMILIHIVVGSGESYTSTVVRSTGSTCWIMC